ncbi:MAG TPA: hypothetical protein VGS22_10335 [Thermoanaerobaculia bacterium]|jgi:hypothetical protein|nr:hypothetical protein [Thermoanaerobaculia bacterium]
MARQKRNLLAKIFLFAMLEVGALAGAPIRPDDDDIENLTRLMHGTQVVQVVRRENDGDGDPPDS